MAVRKDTPKVVTEIDDAAVETVWKLGHVYRDQVATDDLDALKVAIGREIVAHATFQPIYAVAEAAWLKDNAGKKYGPKLFVATMNGRVQVLHDNPKDTIGLSDAQMGNIIRFTGDADHHAEMLELFISAMATDEKGYSLDRYRTFLRDFANEYYTEDCTARTPKGKAALKANVKVYSTVRVSSVNIDDNLEGHDVISKLAWIDALIEDLQMVRISVVRGISIEDKKAAAKLVRNARESEGRSRVTLPELA